MSYHLAPGESITLDARNGHWIKKLDRLNEEWHHSRDEHNVILVERASGRRYFFPMEMRHGMAAIFIDQATRQELIRTYPVTTIHSMFNVPVPVLRFFDLSKRAPFPYEMPEPRGVELWGDLISDLPFEAEFEEVLGVPELPAPQKLLGEGI